LALYSVSLILYVVSLYRSKNWIGRGATLLLAGGIIVHWFALLQRARELQAVPYQDLVGSMSLFAWLLAVTYLGIEAYHRQRSVGPFVMAFVLALIALSTWMSPAAPPPAPPTRGVAFALHVTLNILAYSAFALSFVMSLIYLLQNRLLRDRRLTETFWRFPPLELLERMSRSSVIVGVVALIAGIGLGIFVAARLWKGPWNLDAKVIASLLTLVIYIVYLRVSRTTAWRGARASLLCVLSFLVVIFSYSVVNLYLSKQHRYF